MRPIHALSMLLLLTAAWAVLPAPEAASHSSWSATGSARPIFAQQSGGPAWASSPGAGGTGRSHLPNSTMPHTLSLCSVDTSDNPATCSAGPNFGNDKCSSHVDGPGFCSVQGAQGGTNPAACSTFGDGSCSTLQPIAAVGSGAICSVENAVGGSTICSVMDLGKKDVCTAQNPCLFFNTCSVRAVSGIGARCSVINGGTQSSNFCSTGYRLFQFFTVTCSAYTAGTACSVRVGSKGACSAFLGARSTTCSSTAGAGHCSVIGGQPGTRCSYP